MALIELTYLFPQAFLTKYHFHKWFSNDLMEVLLKSDDTQILGVFFA